MKRILSYALLLSVAALPAVAQTRGRVSLPAQNVAVAGTNTRATSANTNTNIKLPTATTVNAFTRAGGTPAATTTVAATTASAACPESYRECMNQFCLMDASQGKRCACSNRIIQMDARIASIREIQDNAQTIWSTGVEREQRGARADYIFDNTAAATETADIFSADTNPFVVAATTATAVNADNGDALYASASAMCAAKLAECGDDAAMQKLLYERSITNDCNEYSADLDEQEAAAKSQLASAERAQRDARAKMFDTVNKYNEGECSLAYKSCVSNMGGCGANFENCITDAELTAGADACLGILDSCVSSRAAVLAKWAAGKSELLKSAGEYAAANRRETCMSRIDKCLVESCGVGTNAGCLNIAAARGVCSVISECDADLGGGTIMTEYATNKLADIGVEFCANDIVGCLAEKCGADFSGAACMNSTTASITAMCPQNLYTSCRTVNKNTFDTSIMAAAKMNLDWRFVDACQNYMGEQLNRLCGADMSCFPENQKIALAKSLDELGRMAPTSKAKRAAGSIDLNADAASAAAQFTARFQTIVTVSNCGGNQSVYDAEIARAKFVIEQQAFEKYEHDFNMKKAELTRAADIETASATCDSYAADKVEIAFDRSTRICTLMRIQTVCETSGENRWTSALKGAGGGLAAGAAGGTMLSAGKGTVWGMGIGAVGGAILGGLAGGEKKNCQDIPVSEKIQL